MNLGAISGFWGAFFFPSPGGTAIRFGFVVTAVISQRVGGIREGCMHIKQKKKKVLYFYKSFG